MCSTYIQSNIFFLKFNLPVHNCRSPTCPVLTPLLLQTSLYYMLDPKRYKPHVYTTWYVDFNFLCNLLFSFDKAKHRLEKSANKSCLFILMTNSLIHLLKLSLSLLSLSPSLSLSGMVDGGTLNLQ